jgi:quinol monooxygenase YgiN
MTTPQVAVIARIESKPGQRDGLVGALQGIIDAVASEPGTLRYILHTDDQNADVVWFYEQYTDAAALGAHGSSDTMKTLGPIIGEFSNGKVDLHMITPVSGKGL